jgi:hypothetical protein
MEMATKRAWMSGPTCKEPGCGKTVPKGHRICLEHRAAHSAKWNAQLLRDLHLKNRKCVNHPDRPAITYAAMLRCDECYKAYKREKRIERERGLNAKKNV